MRNVHKGQLITAIKLSPEEFEEALNKAIYGENITEDDNDYIICSCDGCKLDYDVDGLQITDVHSKLAEYFGVSKITLIYADIYDYGWINTIIEYEE